MGCGNAREHLLMMRHGAVSLFLLAIGCATAAGQEQAEIEAASSACLQAYGNRGYLTLQAGP